MSHNSIRRQLVVYTIFIMTMAVLVLSVLAGNTLETISDALQEQSRVTYIEHNKRLAATFDAQLKAIEDTTRAIGSLVNAQNGDLLLMHTALFRNSIISENHIFRINVIRFTRPYQIITFEAENDAYFTHVASQRVDTLPETWYLPAANGSAVWHIQDSGSSDGVVSIAVPFYDRQQHITGIAISDVRLDTIRGLLWQVMDSSEQLEGYNLLFSPNDHFLSAYGMNAVSSGEDHVELLTADDLVEIAPVVDFITSNDLTGVVQLPETEMGISASFVMRSDISTTGWQLISIVPEYTLPSLPSSSVTALLIVELVAIVILVVFIYQFFSSRVTRPLAMLNRAAQEIGAGDMRYQVDYRERHDEIGKLANALEDMKTNLSHSYQQLARWSRKLEKRVAERTRALEAAEKEAKEKARELRALHDESLAVVSEHNLQPLLQKFTERIQTLLNTNYCGIWLLNEEKNILKNVSKGGYYEDDTQTADKGLVGKVIQSGKPCIVNEYPNWSERLSTPLPTSIHRVICVPLIYSGKPFGAVEAARGVEDEPFNERDERLMTLFANLVAPAVHNAQLYVQLDQARREAERANQVKTRFLASVTHELRTPLNLIINNMDFMRVGAFGSVSEEQVLRLDQTIRSAEHLLYLINDLLDASKIEAGEMRLFIQMNDVYPILEDSLASAVALLDNVGKGSQVALTADFPENIPPLPMDARRVRQVLINLLSNAVKFTDAGEILLRVEVHDHEVQFSVCDTGIGVPEDEQFKLFEAFERSHHALEMGIEGTGLGLPISRFLVEAHGGRLTFTSTYGKGSTFTFTLPREEIKTTKITDTQIFPVLVPQTE